MMVAMDTDTTTDTTNGASIQQELQAMLVCHDVLGPLDPEQRARALRWLADLHHVQLPAETLDQDQLVATAAAWASDTVLGMTAAEIEQSCLDAAGWGDGPSLAEAMLREIARRLRIMGGIATAPDQEALWPST